MFSVSDRYQLSALFRVFMAAKFNPRTSDTDLPASPFVGHMAAQVRDALMAMEVEREGNAAKERWEEWLAIGPHRREWQVAIDFATREFKESWRTWDTADRREVLEHLFSPFPLAPDMILKIEDELQERWGAEGHRQ